MNSSTIKCLSIAYYVHDSVPDHVRFLSDSVRFGPIRWLHTYHYKYMLFPLSFVAYHSSHVLLENVNSVISDSKLIQYIMFYSYLWQQTHSVQNVKQFIVEFLSSCYASQILTAVTQHEWRLCLHCWIFWVWTQNVVNTSASNTYFLHLTMRYRVHNN